MCILCCSCLHEINKKDADILTAQLTLEQLQQRDQLLSAQNEMLKVISIKLYSTKDLVPYFNLTHFGTLIIIRLKYAIGPCTLCKFEISPLIFISRNLVLLFWI